MSNETTRPAASEASEGVDWTQGRRAFEAYNGVKGGLTWDGRPIPTWAEIGANPKTQDVIRAWEAGAQAVIEAERRERVAFVRTANLLAGMIESDLRIDVYGRPGRPTFTALRQFLACEGAWGFGADRTELRAAMEDFRAMLEGRPTPSGATGFGFREGEREEILRVLTAPIEFGG